MNCETPNVTEKTDLNMNKIHKDINSRRSFKKDNFAKLQGESSDYPDPNSIIRKITKGK